MPRRRGHCLFPFLIFLLATNENWDIINVKNCKLQVSSPRTVTHSTLHTTLYTKHSTHSHTTLTAHYTQHSTYTHTTHNTLHTHTQHSTYTHTTLYTLTHSTLHTQHSTYTHTLTHSTLHTTLYIHTHYTQHSTHSHTTLTAHYTQHSTHSHTVTLHTTLYIHTHSHTALYIHTHYTQHSTHSTLHIHLLQTPSWALVVLLSQIDQNLMPNHMESFPKCSSSTMETHKPREAGCWR